MPYCGNNKVEIGEQCEPGIHGGNCKTDCTWNAVCGDGTTQSFAGEECDAGDANNDEAS